MTKPSDELLDTISLRSVLGYIYIYIHARTHTHTHTHTECPVTLRHYLRTSLLTSYRHINAIPTCGRLVRVTRLREFELGICACRYPSAGCMAGSHQQLTADIYTNCFKEMTCQLSQKPFLSPHTVSCATSMTRHTSIPKLVRTLHPGRRRPFVTLLLQHFNTV